MWRPKGAPRESIRSIGRRGEPSGRWEESIDRREKSIGRREESSDRREESGDRREESSGSPGDAGGRREESKQISHPSATLLSILSGPRCVYEEQRRKKIGPAFFPTSLLDRNLSGMREDWVLSSKVPSRTGNVLSNTKGGNEEKGSVRIPPDVISRQAPL